MDAHTTQNRRYWDQLARIHPRTAFYKLEAFKRGENILDPIERDALGDVSGKRLLQLQCHFGLETLNLARYGAMATGLDFSGVAIATARALGEELNIPSTFIESDVLQAPETLTGFDIVFASWGALCWISDLKPWMQTAARALKTGGRLFLVEAHPAGMMLDLGAPPGTPLTVRDPYAASAPVIEEMQGSYADGDAVLESPRYAIWAHGLEQIFTALLEAGFALRRFREFDRVAWPMPAVVKADAFYWNLPDTLPYVPLSFALEAERV
jgi:SAM-dependent methyltransferase